VNTGVDDEGGETFGIHIFERVVEVEEFETKVVEPVNVDGVVNMPNEINVVGLDAYM
jgi:hypothetical protein